MNVPARWGHHQPGGWGPLADFDDVYQPIRRWLERTGTELATWKPAADLEETEDNYVVHAELPGISREDVSIDLDDRELEIHGETREPQRSGTVRAHTRNMGRFDYRMRLPGSVDADNVAANLAEGILTVTLPKSTQTKGRRIEITEP